MTTAIVGTLFVLLCVLLAIAGLVLAHRLVPISTREGYNTVAGIIYMPLSGLFGIVTAFTVFLAWQQFDAAYKTVQREASELSDVYWRADDLPEPQRQQIQQLAHSYAQAVIDEEWPLMGQGQESPHAWAIVDNLRRSIDSIEPSTASEQTLYSRQVTDFDDMTNDRRIRLLESREGIPPILWTVLLIGAPLIIGFTYLFGLKSFRGHLVMVAVLTVVIATVLFTIKTLEYPFTGDTRVTPGAFESVLQGFDANSEQ